MQIYASFSLSFIWPEKYASAAQLLYRHVLISPQLTVTGSFYFVENIFAVFKLRWNVRVVAWIVHGTSFVYGGAAVLEGGVGVQWVLEGAACAGRVGAAARGGDVSTQRQQQVRSRGFELTLTSKSYFVLNNQFSKV